MFKLDNPAVTLALLPFCSIDTPPVGLAILTGILRQRAYTTTTLDLNLETRERAPGRLLHFWSGHHMEELVGPTQFATLSSQIEDLVAYCVDRLLEAKTEVIGLSLFTTNVRFTIEVVKRLRLREPGKIIIFGGPSCKVVGERQWVGPGVTDAWVCGDGEQALPAILDPRNLPADAPPGVYLGLDIDPAFTMEQCVAQDLEAFPFPDYDDLLPSRYERRSHKDEPMLPVVASRGCIMRCAFCNERSMEARYRTRGADHIYAELEHLHRRYQPVAFRFNDQLFNGNLKVLSRLADLIIEGGLDIRWVAQGIARGDMSDDLLERLRQAGLEQVCFGIESGSPAVMELMGKNTKLLDPEVAIRRCHSAGIRAHINLMTGFPGETEQRFQETLDLLSRCKDHIDMVENVHPFFLTPGSEVDQHPQAFGVSHLGTHLNRAMMWTGEGGNNYSQRKERVLRLARHLEALGIPFDPSWLHLYDEQMVGKSRLQISNLEPRDEQGEPVERLPPGDAVIIAADYFVDDEVMDPCFRLQLFCKDPEGGEDIFIFGTNTERFKLRTGPLPLGHGEVSVKLSPLNLGPGTYTVTFGVWPSEDADHALDVRHGGATLKVEAETDQPGALLPPWGKWRVRGEEGYRGELAQPGPWDLAPLYLVAHAPAWIDTVATAGFVTAALRCPVELPPAALARASILHGATVVTRLERTLPAWVKGGDVIQWLNEDLPLLGGDYEVRIQLEATETGALLMDEGHGLKVTSTETQGAGLVYLPATWKL